MEIAKGIEIIDLCLKIENNLIIADIHMGFEEELTKQGIMLPAMQYKDTIKKLKTILKKAQAGTIIINGDLKHEFGRISDTEWRNTLNLLDIISKYCNQIILIKGNHDTFLGPIAKKINIEIKDYHKIKDIYICHGHQLPNDEDYKKSKTVIIGHEHPAINLTQEGRTEKYKCFLKNKYENKTLIVMPSFNILTEGNDILKEETLSPFLKKELSDSEITVIGDEPYYFGKLKNLQ